MKLRFYLTALLILAASITVVAQSPAPDAAELTKLLNDFLAGASRSDAQIHDAFWADDLIYTRSAGSRVNKAEVMRSVRSAPAPKPTDPKTIYTAEDIRIQQYGTTAIVAFRLVATTEKDGTRQVANLLNSGTFLKRNGKWQVVNWQSTRMPQSAEAAKAEALAAHDAFFRALVRADTNKLGPLIHNNFIWTRSSQQVTRQQLLDELSSGQLRVSRIDPSNVTASVYGDTAVIRGTATVQRSAVPGGSPDATPFNIAYTFVLANQGGGWLVVAIHGSALT